MTALIELEIRNRIGTPAAPAILLLRICLWDPSMAHPSDSSACHAQHTASRPGARQRSSASRKELVRSARAKAASELSQALTDLALEREMNSELRIGRQASDEALAQLSQENRNLSAELKQLRAADIPNLLHSIALVIELHALVVCNSCTRPADTRQRTPSPAAPLQHSPELSPLVSDRNWSSPASSCGGTDRPQSLYAEFCLYMPLEEGSQRECWPGSPSSEAA